MAATRHDIVGKASMFKRWTDSMWPIAMATGLLFIAAVAWYPQPCEEPAAASAPNASLPVVTAAEPTNPGAGTAASGGAPSNRSRSLEPAEPTPRHLVEWLLAVMSSGWVAGLFGWFLHCFTGDAFVKRTKGIAFAYFFTVLAFGVVAVMITDIGKAEKFGVIDGCVVNLDPNSRIPIQCDFPTHADPQWLGTKAPTPAPKPASGVLSKPASSTPDTQGTKPAFLSFVQSMENYGENRNTHYLVNIGGHPEKIPELNGPAQRCTPAVYAIRGGLPVPVFFVLIALMGGAISLARNVPGIQKRSDVDWVGTAAEPKLLPGDARELLIFQVLQFVSAPLIAVAAYHTIKPESLASTVALGFFAGFASDNILAQMRLALKGSQTTGGLQPASPTAGSVHGTVLDALAAGKPPLAGARVELLGTAISALSAADGAFTLGGVPLSPTPYSLQITLSGTARSRLVPGIAMGKTLTVNVGPLELS